MPQKAIHINKPNFPKVSQLIRLLTKSTQLSLQYSPSSWTRSLSKSLDITDLSVGVDRAGKT